MSSVLMEMPSEIILTVTASCNHRCEMCYYHHSLNQKKTELSIDEYRSLSNNLGEVRYLLISGGEPFLRQDLREIISIFYADNQTRNVFIPTNGSDPKRLCRVVRTILDTMPELALSMMLSLEGLEADHDRIHGKSGAFASTIESITELNFLRVEQLSKGKMGFGIFLNSVVFTQNISQIVPLMEHIKGRVWVDMHTFSPMRGIGRTTRCTPPDGAQFEGLIRLAKPYFDYYLKRKGDGYTKALSDRYALWLRLLEGKKLERPCQAGNCIGVIEPDGGVRLCELTVPIGNLREVGFDFQRLWRSQEAESLRESLKKCSCTHACFISATDRYYSSVSLENFSRTSS
ncbi:MAG: radical SAM protein [Deltaproteobacteria bacterium]|nr:radical SAM protein [Deltaproteobacteria bacterium]